MKLTLYTDYSLRVLMYLGIHGDRSVTIGEIASRHGISRNHVMKVVHELGQLGYLQTIRGKNGGIRLGRLPEQIRSEEHTSELQSLMRISYAVFCLKKKNIKKKTITLYHKQHTN